MTNPMLAELDEVVRLSERAAPGKVELHTSCSWRRIVAARGRPFLVPTIDPDRHQNMDTTESAEFVVALVNWFRTHHATLADMAKRLEAAERDSRRLEFLQKEVDAIGAYLLHNGSGSGKGFTGLDLKNTGRTLRKAIDQCLEADAATQEGEG